MKIWHFGNIFIHPDSVIGANCTLRQGVTIGNRQEGGPVPTLEDDVELGAYAQVLGGNPGRAAGPRWAHERGPPIDVPAGATAVGIPARIVGNAGVGSAPSPIRANRPAVFLDRDGTIIEHVHYLADPARGPTSSPGAASAPSDASRLRAGFALVVVTNQSAIGRGMITVEQYEAGRRRDEAPARRSKG